MERWRLFVTKANSLRLQKQAKRLERLLQENTKELDWTDLDAVIQMGRQMPLEYVEGSRFLILGDLCPRCFEKQTRVRRVRAYKSETGQVIVYSCPECKRVVAMETLGETNAGTNAELSDSTLAKRSVAKIAD